MPKYTFEIVCQNKLHPQGTQDETAFDEFEARKFATLHRIRGRICDICSSPLQFSLEGNPLLVDGQPPQPRIPPTT